MTVIKYGNFKNSFGVYMSNENNVYRWLTYLGTDAVDQDSQED